MADPVTFPDTFNMASYFVDANIQAGRGAKTAIRYEGKSITYQQVFENVNRAGNGLLNLGLQAEQRVLVCLQDRPEFAYAWFGTLKAGGVATQINPQLPTADYVYYLNYTKAVIAIVDAAALAEFEPAIKQARYLREVIVVGSNEGTRSQWTAWEDWVQKWSPEMQAAPTSKDDPAVWLFTSGTTGQSKGAVHTHAHFAFNTEVYAKRFIGLRESDITIAGPRLFFGYATGTNLMFPFAVGATTVLFRDRPLPPKLFELIEREKVTVFTSVPTLINNFLQAPLAERKSLKNIRFMWSAGEALPRDLHERWEKEFGVPIVDGIGSAESFHIYISNRPGDIRPGSLGKLVPGYEARLLGDDGVPVKAGDVGTLWVGGDSVALYYHASYEKSKEHLRGGWVVSGDKFRCDEQGYWWYEGRGDDLLKVAGIYVSPLEVENALLQHASVKEVCVIGREDEAGLTKPLAYVVLREGKGSAKLAEELIAFSKERLARYKAPRWVEFRAEALPRNDRDKIDRKKLRAEDQASRGKA